MDGFPRRGEPCHNDGQGVLPPGVWNRDINKHTDWMGDQSTGYLPVSGDKVQKFIKGQLAAKVGAFHADKDRGLVYAFADYEDLNRWLENPEQNRHLIVATLASSDYSTEELAREEAEKLRTQSENFRIQQEQLRAMAESERVSAELSRANAEAAREQAEEARQAAELERQRAEEKRAADAAEINSTLATLDSRVSDTEADVTNITIQLADMQEASTDETEAIAHDMAF